MRLDIFLACCSITQSYFFSVLMFGEQGELDEGDATLCSGLLLKIHKFVTMCHLSTKLAQNIQ